MFLDGSFFGFEAVSHEWNEVFDNAPVSTCPKGPEEGWVCAGKIVVFECLRGVRSAQSKII
jgi:hypothetical protein